MDHQRIGMYIADCRRAKRMTQVQLADELGITDKAVSKWERGLAMPSYSIIIKLCNILDISASELLQRGEQQ